MPSSVPTRSGSAVSSGRVASTGALGRTTSRACGVTALGGAETRGGSDRGAGVLAMSSVALSASSVIILPLRVDSPNLDLRELTPELWPALEKLFAPNG